MEAKSDMNFIENLIHGGNGRSKYEFPEGVKGNNGSPECVLVKTECRLVKGECVELYFINKGGKSAIVLTDKRFIKTENGNIVSTVNLVDITRVDHEKNGMFAWDKVVTYCGKERETFGIYEGLVCKFFVDTLNRIIKSLQSEYTKRGSGSGSGSGQWAQVKKQTSDKQLKAGYIMAEETETETTTNVKPSKPWVICTADGCQTRAHYGVAGGDGPTHCKPHKKENMVNVVDPLCKLCDIKAFYNYAGQTVGEYCTKHKLKDMVDVVRKKA